MALTGNRLDAIFDLKDQVPGETWRRIDEAIVIFDPDDPPYWLPETDEDGMTRGAGTR